MSAEYDATRDHIAASVARLLDTLGRAELIV